jgi:hypothetical protein
LMPPTFRVDIPRGFFTNLLIQPSWQTRLTITTSEFVRDWTHPTTPLNSDSIHTSYWKFISSVWERPVELYPLYRWETKAQRDSMFCLRDRL